MKSTLFCLILLILGSIYSCKNATEPKSREETGRPLTVKGSVNSEIPAPSTMIKSVSGGPVKSVSSPGKPARKDSVQKVNTLNPLVSSDDNRNEKPCQEFRLQNQKDTLVKLKEGTTIRIPAYAFVYKDDGNPVKGHVIFSAKEYYKISDIILAGLSTRTEKNILETGGMVFLKAMAGGRACELAPDKFIEIGFPTSGKKDNMKLYDGYPDANNKIIWRPAGESAEKYASELFTVVEDQPEYPGGDEARIKFLQETIKYPYEAKERGIQGKVFATFVVEEDGSLSDIRILRGIGGGCDEEVIRVLSRMPSWIPGKQRGKPVRVQYTLPVRVNLGGARESANGGNQFMTRNIILPDSSNKAIRNTETFSNILKSNRLGWLNCDRLFEFNAPKMNFPIADKDPEEVDVAIVFQNARVILAPSFTHDGKIVFVDVPKNEPVTIVAIKKKDDKRFLSMKETRINEFPAMELSYREISSEELRIELEKLNR